jgi:CheY-like chemotaxis protein
MGAGTVHPLSILLVDDHVESISPLAKLLRHCGHTVHTAGSVQEAKAKFASERLDLLVADIALPDGCGSDVMKAFQQTYGKPGIALTGHGEEHYAKVCQEAGFAARLLKPVVFDDLIAAIEAALPERPEPVC